MKSAFGVEHTLGDEYRVIAKSMAAQVPGGLKAIGRAATTPKQKKLAQATEAGRAARTSTTKFGGPKNVHPSEFDSRPARVFRNKRKAWESGYYG
jgi:hypothetical protein